MGRAGRSQESMTDAQMLSLESAREHDESEVSKRELAAQVDAACRFLEGFRPASAWAVLLAAVAFGAVLISSHHLTPVTDAIDVLFGATNGWISAMLVYPAIALGFMWLAIGRLGRLRGRDIGWRSNDLWGALLATAFVWGGAQGSLLALDRAQGFVADLTWSGRLEASVFGALFSQLLGNALAEETLMRGILLPQIYHRLARFVPRGTALCVSIALNLALAVLYHVPAYLQRLNGSALIEGLFFVLQFSRSHGNDRTPPGGRGPRS
jgi:membrane protease YdiL (CAAX protease family)